MANPKSAPAATTKREKSEPRAKTLNKKRTEWACAQAVHKIGHYIGYRLTLSDDMRMTLFVYAVAANDPKRISVVTIDDPKVVRIAAEVGNRPSPKNPDKKSTEENEE